MGGFLTTGYCLRTINYCFPEIFVGAQGVDGGEQSRDGEDPPVHPLGKTLSDFDLTWWKRLHWIRNSNRLNDQKQHHQSCEMEMG